VVFAGSIFEGSFEILAHGATHSFPLPAQARLIRKWDWVGV
jgi:hypothetical protein